MGFNLVLGIRFLNFIFSSKDLEIVEFNVESDCMEVIRALRKSKGFRSSFGFIIVDILTLANLFSACDFTHIRREGNKVAYVVRSLN